MLVPIPMTIWVAQHNQERIFQFFLFLKWLYKCGKTKLSNTELHAIASMMNYSDIRPIQSHIDKLIEWEWLRLNEKTEFYLIASFDRLRHIYGWESRASIECTLDEINNVRAIVGASIFAYQHKDFWRKVKREKSVCIKGRTYHFLSPSFNYSNHFAPVATTGIEALHNISKSKASELKHAAMKADYIIVKKDFDTTYSEADINLLIKYCDAPRNIRKLNGKVVLQLIDLVLPNISIKKRHKLGT
jgi:hypothetical protein